ncbi:hypothetical protein GGR50DRAFT_359175 [Xylaria sp. CBS 124048]|nr:hypothetical protein GGR50DRAFT_359175 [Xylaria sp. CBS 124048]
MTLRAFIRGIAAHSHAVSSLTAAGRSRIQLSRNQLISSSRFFSEASVSDPAKKVHIYISRSKDPYINLSVEHYLLHKSHEDAIILFLYINRPCVVIGRNQNPWLEVNLALLKEQGYLRRRRQELKAAESATEKDDDGDPEMISPEEVQKLQPAEDDQILLVRRRSGGGTVFHDIGNVNYGVITPRSMFHRDTYAEMIARVLRGLNVPHNVRVNKRHDIVLEVDEPPAKEGDKRKVKEYKISGSAYRLIPKRALHHGTCLLSSPHLPFMKELLQSPVAPFIKGRGVNSVSSPVRNVGISIAEFNAAVIDEFSNLYRDKVAPKPAEGTQPAKSEIQIGVLDASDALVIPEIRRGIAELRSWIWIYGQTPQFTFASIPPIHEDGQSRPALPSDLPPTFVDNTDPDAATPHSKKEARGMQFTVRDSQIFDAFVPGLLPQANGKRGRSSSISKLLVGQRLQHIDDWSLYFKDEYESVGRWLNGLFGVQTLKPDYAKKD